MVSHIIINAHGTTGGIAANTIINGGIGGIYVIGTVVDFTHDNLTLMSGQAAKGGAIDAGTGQLVGFQQQPIRNIVVHVTTSPCLVLGVTASPLP